MAYIVLAVLRETRPLWYFILAAALFILSQLAYFLLSKVICKVSPLPSPVPLHSHEQVLGFGCESRWIIHRHVAGNRFYVRTVLLLEKYHRGYVQTLVAI
jgi:hypothetical protein